jgi:hypothetical protein
VNRSSYALTPEEALNRGLFHVNVSTPEMVSREELIMALKVPTRAMACKDHVTHALEAFMLETHETSLAKIASGAEISWKDLAGAAEATLQASDPKRRWIVERAFAE